MRLCLIMWLAVVASTVTADEPTVTLQIRGKDGRVRSTQTVTLSEEKRVLSLPKFLQSLATDHCSLIKAQACQLGEIYRTTLADNTVHEVFRAGQANSASTGPSVGTLQSGDIIVFYQGAYCCGF